MKLTIENYKSIRSLELESRRVNVLIGEPNCGKTNVIEALNLLGSVKAGHVPRLFRCEGPIELFHDNDISSPLAIELGDLSVQLSSQPQNQLQLFSPSRGKVKVPLNWGGSSFGGNWNVKRYEFRSSDNFPDSSVAELLAPFGENLADLLASKRELRIITSEMFSGSGFRIEIRVREKRIAVMKEVDGLVISYPFSASSETLRRMLFYRLAVETNQDSILLFDEPEANAFPLFTKLFAEQIAADSRGNAFFLTTHSPYILDSLIEKTPKEDLAVILCRMENYETRARVLGQPEVEEILDLGASAFFNLDRLGSNDALA